MLEKLLDNDLYRKFKDIRHNQFTKLLVFVFFTISLITVVSAGAPTFITIPENSFIFYGNQSVNVIFNATNDSDFGGYYINDTRFSITQIGFETLNQTAVLTNVTPLAVDTYLLNISINDTSNINNWTFYSVEVKQYEETCQVLYNETSPLEYLMHFNVWANCTSAFVLSRNGTTIVNNSEQILSFGAYNFSVLRNDTVNYTYIFNESEFIIVDTIFPTITIKNPAVDDEETSNPIRLLVETSEEAICDYSLDNATNVSLGTDDYFSEYFNLTNGEHSFRVFCNDTFGNQNLTGAVVDFYVNIFTAGAIDTSQGASSGTVTITQEVITLDSVNITWDDFYFNQSAYVYVTPYDIDGNIINITSINISILDNIEYKQGVITRQVDGTYRQSFNILTPEKDVNITQFTISVIATQGLKTITDEKVILITEPSFLEQLKSREILLNILDFIKTNWLIIMIIAVLIVFVTIIFIAIEI